MTNKHSINDLYQMQALSLASKIQMSKARIRAWIEEYGEDGVYVSFSGGKPLFRKALETLIPIVSKTIVEEMKKSEDHINKYTKGIIK